MLPSLHARRNGLLLALAGAVLFSAKAIVAKFLYRYALDAVTVLAFRMVFSLPVFLGLALWKSRHPVHLDYRDRVRLVLMGLLGYYLSSFLDFLGLQTISVGLERLILFLTPSFVLLFSSLMMRRRVSKQAWLSLGLAYCGVVLVFWQDVRLGGPGVVRGALYVLGAAVAYALYLLESGVLVQRLGSVRLVAYVMCISSLACIAQFVVLKPLSAWQQPAAVYGWSIVNAMLCTVFPVLCTMLAIRRIGAATTSQASMIGPVSTLFLGAALLDEPITLWQWAGTALVLSGMYRLARAPEPVVA